jgi:S-adenosylmethionine:tRNA ribosyltransferase-isomerase
MGERVGIATVVLHCGVSSLEVGEDRVDEQVLYPEPFEVPEATARAVDQTRHHGHRVVAVGTTVVRALESSWEEGRVRPRRGLTRLYVQPPGPLRAVQGLLTGLHDPLTSHLALLFALGPPRWVREAYQVAVRAGLLWHEFGDSHLILPEAAGAG